MWEMLPLMTCVGLEVGPRGAGGCHETEVAVCDRSRVELAAADLVVIATLMSVAAPLKIWNNTRIEMNLERHQQLLLRARMDALSSQINPHFLFNTLNTVSAMIRMDPDTARGVVLKLSNILRRLLRKHETFVPLREELSFIDDYLDIEVARFGEDNLDIVKEIDDRHAGNVYPQHAAAADGGEQPEAWTGAKTGRWADSSAYAKQRRAASSSKSPTTAWAFPKKRCRTFMWKASD